MRGGEPYALVGDDTDWFVVWAIGAEPMGWLVAGVAVGDDMATPEGGDPV